MRVTKTTKNTLPAKMQLGGKKGGSRPEKVGNMKGMKLVPTGTEDGQVIEYDLWKGKKLLGKYYVEPNGPYGSRIGYRPISGSWTDVPMLVSDRDYPEDGIGAWRGENKVGYFQPDKDNSYKFVPLKQQGGLPGFPGFTLPPSLVSAFQDTDFSNWGSIQSAAEAVGGQNVADAFAQDDPSLITGDFMQSFSQQLGRQQAYDENPLRTAEEIEMDAEEAAKRRTFLGIGKRRAKRKARQELEDMNADRQAQNEQLAQAYAPMQQFNTTNQYAGMANLFGLLDTFQFQEGGNMSRLGYSVNSPYRNMPAISIPGNNITMAKTDMPLMAYPDVGQPRLMRPFSGTHHFPGARRVLEVPVQQTGGLTNNRMPLYRQEGGTTAPSVVPLTPQEMAEYKKRQMEAMRGMTQSEREAYAKKVNEDLLDVIAAETGGGARPLSPERRENFRNAFIEAPTDEYYAEQDRAAQERTDQRIRNSAGYALPVSGGVVGPPAQVGSSVYRHASPGFQDQRYDQVYKYLLGGPIRQQGGTVRGYNMHDDGTNSRIGETNAQIGRWRQEWIDAHPGYTIEDQGNGYSRYRSPDGTDSGIVYLGKDPALAAAPSRQPREQGNVTPIEPREIAPLQVNSRPNTTPEVNEHNALNGQVFIPVTKSGSYHTGEPVGSDRIIRYESVDGSKSYSKEEYEKLKQGQIPNQKLGGKPKKKYYQEGGQGAAIGAQLEDAEVFTTEQALIMETAARDKHKNMKKDLITDVLGPKDYVFSDMDKAVFSRKDAEAMSFGVGGVLYEEGEKPDMPKETTAADLFKEGEDEVKITDYVRRIRDKYKIRDIDEADVFTKRTNAANQEARIPFLMAASAANEKKRTGKMQVGYASEFENMFDNSIMNGANVEKEDGEYGIYPGDGAGVPEYQLGGLAIASALIGPLTGIGLGIGQLGAARNNRRDISRYLAQDRRDIGRLAATQSGYSGMSTAAQLAGVIGQNPYVEAPKYDTTQLDATVRRTPRNVFDLQVSRLSAASRPYLDQLFNNAGNFSEAVNAYSPVAAANAGSMADIGMNQVMQDINMENNYRMQKQGYADKQMLADVTARNATRTNTNQLTNALAGVTSAGIAGQGQIESNRQNALRANNQAKLQNTMAWRQAKANAWRGIGQSAASGLQNLYQADLLQQMPPTAGVTTTVNTNPSFPYPQETSQYPVPELPWESPDMYDQLAPGLMPYYPVDPNSVPTSQNPWATRPRG